MHKTQDEIVKDLTKIVDNYQKKPNEVSTADVRVGFLSSTDLNTILYTMANYIVGEGKEYYADGIEQGMKAAYEDAATHKENKPICQVVDCGRQSTRDDFVDSGRYKIPVCDTHYAEKHSSKSPEHVRRFMLANGFTWDDESDIWLDDLMCEYTDRAAQIMYAITHRVSTASVEEQRALMRTEIEEIRDTLLDNGMLDSNEWLKEYITNKLNHYLPKDNADYWKYHCVTCGLWTGEFRPEQDGYCQCE